MLSTIVNKINLFLTIVSYYFYTQKEDSFDFEFGKILMNISYNTLIYNIMYSVSNIYSKDMYIIVSLLLYIYQLKDTCIKNKFKTYLNNFFKKFKCDI